MVCNHEFWFDSAVGIHNSARIDVGPTWTSAVLNGVFDYDEENELTRVTVTNSWKSDDSVPGSSFAPGRDVQYKIPQNVRSTGSCGPEPIRGPLCKNFSKALYMVERECVNG